MIDRAAYRRWPILGDAEHAAVRRVLERGILSGSAAPEATAFERDFARWTSAEYALLTHSGTSALVLALAASGIGAGDHVLVPAYSFVATPLAVVQCGAIPIFVDVDARTGLMSADAAAEARTPRTRAVMPVHIHGCAADIDSFIALGLPVIEDAAQAHGATWRGKPVGALGRAGAFSLQSSKNLGVGEGGVFVTNDRAIAELANRIRNFGQPVPLADAGGYDAERPLDGARALTSAGLGAMYRGNELTAALARTQLAALDARTARAQRHAESLSRALSALPGVLPPEIPEGATSVHHKYRVRLDPVRAGVDASPSRLRDAVSRALVAEGLEVVVWQAEGLAAHPVFQERRGFGLGFPWAIDRETDFARLYDPARFPNTNDLLDGSLVLFSQSCPLIAQDESLIAAYAEAFTRVWEKRHDLVRGTRT